MLRLALLTLILLSVLAGSASAFPGANGKIAFETDRGSAGDDEIFVMNADGGAQTNLTNNAAGDYHPAWSPGGTKIAFWTFRGGSSEVFVMNADGSGQTNLTNHPGGDDEPAWSSDGAKIGFHSFRDGNSEVYVMNADGSGQTNLTANPGPDYAPAWAPGGDKIAFHSFRDGNDEIYVMSPDGSGQANLTSNPANDTEPAWSPDGTKIAFQTYRGGNYEIFVMNADGSGQTNLSNNPGADRVPAWSPDGTKIAFYSSRDGNDEIYMMKPDGSGQTNLTNIGAGDQRPDWQSLARPGGPVGSGPQPTDTTAPRLSRVSLTNKRFRYRLSEAARVTFAIQRKLLGRRVGGKCRQPTRRNRSRRKCTRYKTVGRLTQNGAAGRNKKSFSGRLEGRKLKPGRYRARLTAQDAAGNRSRTATVSFRVAPA